MFIVRKLEMSAFRAILLSALAATLVLQVASAQSEESFGNDPAALKPQTPVKGTNILLNTPYKIHYSSKKGCYMMWSNETWLTERLGVSNVLRVVCKDQGGYDTLDASFAFERTKGGESSSEYDGPVHIRNLGQKSYLSHSVSTHGGKPIVFDQSKKEWQIDLHPKIKDRMQLKQNKLWSQVVAYSDDQSDRSFVIMEDGYRPYSIFSFVADVKLHAKMYNFEFDCSKDGDIEKHSRQVDMIDAYDIINNSPATVSRTVSVSEKITDEFSWGFSESLKLFDKVSGSAGIPFLAETKVEAGFEFTGSADQNWKNSKEKTFSMSYDISVPPQSSVRISAWYSKIDGITMSYTADIEITGYGTRITTFNDIVEDSPASGVLIQQELERSEFEGTIVEVKEKSVITRVKGQMIASVGVNVQLNVDGNEVEEQDLPTDELCVVIQ